MRALFTLLIFFSSFFSLAQINKDSINVRRIVKLFDDFDLEIENNNSNNVDSLEFKLNNIITLIKETEKSIKEENSSNTKYLKRLNHNYLWAQVDIIEFVNVPKGDVKGAQYHFNIIKQKDSDVGAFIAYGEKLLGKTKINAKDIAGGIYHYNRSINLSKNWEDSHYDLIGTLFELLIVYKKYGFDTYFEETLNSIENLISTYKDELSEDLTSLDLDVIANKAWFLAKNGDCKTAINLFKTLDVEALKNIELNTDYNKAAADLYFICGAYEESLEYAQVFYNTDKLLENNNDKNIYFANYYLKTNNIKKATYHFNLIKNEKKTIENYNSNNLNFYSEYYAAIGNYKKAYQFKEKNIQKTDSLRSLKTKTINKITADEIRKDNEILLLENQQKEQELATKKEKQILFLFIIVLIIIFLFVFFYTLQKRKIKSKILQLKLEKSQEIVAYKNLFLENLSHEIRTPISVIIGYQTLLKKHTLEPILIKNYSDKTLKIGNQMISSLNDFLTILKQEKTSFNNKISKESLNGFVKNIVYEHSISATLGNKTIYYKTNINDNFIIDYSFDSINKILNNLITNAIKYSLQNSSIHVSLHLNEKNLCLQVKDEGVGIAKNELESVFDRFYQSKNNLNSGGFGIGLSLVKELTEALKGTIEVSSELNNGTTFNVTLPLELHNVSEYQLEKDAVFYNLAEEIETLEKETPKNLPKILMVDDNLEMLSFLKELFSTDYNCYTAVNGQEGLEKAKKTNFNLIISDLRMPIMDGIMFKNEINKLETYKNIPFIMLTAVDYKNVENLVSIIDLSEYLIKPFNPNELMARITNLLERNLYKKSLHKGESKDSVEFHSQYADLMKKINSIVTNNLNNPNFNVKMLATECGMGEKKLNNVLKSKTGLSSKNIILEIRLLKAYDYIINKKHETLNETVFSVGLNSRAYFNKRFESRFGIKPGELKKKY